MLPSRHQNKQKEIFFFDAFSEEHEYNVFTEASNLRLIQKIIDFSSMKKGKLIADLGCGSGIFTKLLKNLGYRVIGLDISQGIIRLGRKNKPDISFIVGDVEYLPFHTESLDGIILSGIVHHLPNFMQLAKEVYRVLKPDGVFVAFDPNRRNPFMYLYRDRNSPFYCSQGVTENERPVLAEEVIDVFSNAGFAVQINYLSGLHYRYVASRRMQYLLPIYNALDSLLFAPELLKRYRAFILTKGEKK